MQYVEDNIIREITKHAEQEFPNECCGVIIKHLNTLKYVPLINKSNTPTKSFLIDPLEFLKYEKHTVLVVHSHPNRTSEPSDADKASCARCNIPYLIISYPSGEISTIYPTDYIAEYEERPFVYGIFDCFGLIKDYYKQELNIEIEDRIRPPYGWWKDIKNESCIATEYKQYGFKKVNDLQKNDIIVMQLQGIMPNHVGVYLGNGLLLHHTLNSISRIEQYGCYWRKNTVFYLRHNNETN